MSKSNDPARVASRDWSSSELREALASAAEWVLAYREGVESRPVFPNVEPGEIQARLGAEPPARPDPFDRVLADFSEDIVPGLTHWNHPGFMAYFASCARGPSVAAELLIAAVGVNAMLWRTSPAATEVELVAVDWLRQALGLPADFRGVILDTASTSTFTALLAARERAGDDVRRRGLFDAPALTVYTSEQSHSSIDKAAMAAGLGLASVRRVAVDERFRMRPEALSEGIDADLAAGARPSFVCATVGTTSTASADPVRAIADVVRRHDDLWLHVDAAYAGSAALAPELRDPFDGWELADSIVVNPHKWMGTSLDCSVLFFRDPTPFRASLALTPAYLESEEAPATNLMDFGLSLGRRFRGLKLWTLFRCVGTDALADTFRGHVRMAADAADRLTSSGRFELAAPVSFSTICVRAVGAGEPDELDAGNRDILRRVNEGDSVFLSHTELDGRYTLRLSVGSAHTEPRHVESAVEALIRAADDLARTEAVAVGTE
ncbi:MAG: pyridoxal-dependent decarboxylase [Gemmatimonadetes bacterium]|nr:pyridoxal-dependent decarboxylase [Gemmatimonadota bacterium]